MKVGDLVYCVINGVSSFRYFRGYLGDYMILTSKCSSSPKVNDYFWKDFVTIISFSHPLF